MNKKKSSLEEIEDDYIRLGGLSEEEELAEALPVSLIQRLPWLCALFGLGMTVSSVVGMFDRVTSAIPLIVSFQSLILGMAGNVGTQSLAITIRALSDDSVTTSGRRRLILKETRIGAAVGLILGALSFWVVCCFLTMIKHTPFTLSVSVSLCTSLSMCISVFLSSISGCSIPMLLERLHIDPAVASGPFITTLNDLVAVVTYYGLAWIMLLHFV